MLGDNLQERWELELESLELELTALDSSIASVDKELKVVRGILEELSEVKND